MEVAKVLQESDENEAKSVNDLFAEAFLDAHNRFRKLHGVTPLRLCPTLCAQAQDWAQRIARKRHMSYCELTVSGVGECITFFPLTATGDEIVQYWYDENRKYEYETPGWQTGTNYFTQIVWSSTTELGVGRAPVCPIIEPMHRSFNANHITGDSAEEATETARRRRNSLLSKSAIGSAAASVPQSPLDDAPAAVAEEQVIVAFYRPAGNNNRAGQFALNVFKPKVAQSDGE